MMVALGDEHPGYGWDENKGYAAPEHLEALRRLGPCVLHRRSWRLPGTMDDDGAVAPGAEPAGAPYPDDATTMADVPDLNDLTDLTRVGER